MFIPFFLPFWSIWKLLQILLHNFKKHLNKIAYLKVNFSLVLKFTRISYILRRGAKNSFTVDLRIENKIGLPNHEIDVTVCCFLPRRRFQSSSRPPLLPPLSAASAHHRQREGSLGGLVGLKVWSQIYFLCYIKTDGTMKNDIETTTDGVHYLMYR